MPMAVGVYRSVYSCSVIDICETGVKLLNQTLG